MRIAVVGSGVSGLVAARELSRRHEVEVFEAASWIGGHTHTVTVEDSRLGRIPVDTGFIVFNEATYPGFCALLSELGVGRLESDMSFSVRDEASGLEYNGTSLNGLLAQRSNAFRPRFWRMVRDILRFYREVPAVLERPDDGTTLGEFLRLGGYSRAFIEHHLIPMGAAVWSSSRDAMWSFPLRFLVQFFHNHGFLQVDDRPQWLVVQGGSSSYVRALVDDLPGPVHLNAPVAQVRRSEGGVDLVLRDGERRRFDRVVMATHADTALELLTDARPTEREVLSAFRFQRNEVTLHTDRRLLPRRRLAWASWNYHVTDPVSELPTVTYWMNRLQSIESETPYLVTLNRAHSIDPAKVLQSFVYHHPIFDRAAVQAQRRHSEIDGLDRVHFCGAYWRFGFHEDGLQSALASVERVGRGVVRA